MKCPKCQAENQSDSAFCEECGAPLEAACPSCGAGNRPTAKFCRKCRAPLSVTPAAAPTPRAYTPKHLADKILQSKSALEGERKQVTVLFADVKGSMELAEQLDPEAWSQIMNRFFQILSEGVERFEVIVGRIGDDLRMDYTAQGHTVGLAQRMEQRAAADSTYLTAHTARLVEGYFQLRDLGDFDLKGVSAPLRAYELQGVGALRTRLDFSRARGFSKCVGREREMATLESALESAIAGHGQVVGVVAEAGTGKSRLCLEFVERCRARGVRVNEGHCPAHGKTIPYLPLL